MKSSDKNVNKNIAIIPARGGSKRVPGKNIREFCGKPLLVYTIQAALASGLFGKVVVSTDSKEITDVARGAGAEVPFIRNSKLSGDYATVSMATADAVERVDPNGSVYKYVAQLMPSCPLRTAEDVKKSFDNFIQLKAMSQISVTDYGWQNPLWAMSLKDEKFLQPAYSEMIKRRSQDLPKLFSPSGAVWWSQTSALHKYKNFYLPNLAGWKISWQHAVDIDTEDDWKIAEILMKIRLISAESKSNG